MKHHPENHRFIKLQFQQNIVSLEAAASQNDHEREVNISFEEIPKQTNKHKQTNPSLLMRVWRFRSSLWRLN